MDQPFIYLLMSAGVAIILVAIILFVRESRKAKKLLTKAEDEKRELLSIIADAELMVDELNNFSDYLLTRIDEKNTEAGEYLRKLHSSINAGEVSPERSDGLSPERSGGLRSEQPDGAAPERSDVAATERPDGDALPGARYGLAAGHDVKKRGVTRGGRRFALRADGVYKGGAYPHMGERREEKPAADAANSADTADDTADDAAASADTGRSASVPAPLILYPLDRDAEHAGRRARARGVDALSRNKKYAEVFRRAGDGMDEAEIARTLGIGRGEVSLILGMNGQTL